MVREALEVPGSQAAAVRQHYFSGNRFKGGAEVVPRFDRHDRAGPGIDLLAQEYLEVVNLDIVRRY